MFLWKGGNSHTLDRDELGRLLVKEGGTRARIGAQCGEAVVVEIGRSLELSRANAQKVWDSTASDKWWDSAG